MEVEQHTVTSDAGQEVQQGEGEPREMVNFTLNFKKEKYDISWPWDDKIGKLRAHITQLTGVPIPLQKLMVKGTADWVIRVPSSL
jgi:hypothetical protein